MGAEMMFWLFMVAGIAFGALRTHVVQQADMRAVDVLYRAAMAAKTGETFAEAHEAMKRVMAHTLRPQWVIGQALVLTRWKFEDFHPTVADVEKALQRMRS